MPRTSEEPRDHEPSVTVVVPVYNGERTIDDCVRSLLELRYPREKLELRVVDNDSRDGTVDALRKYDGRLVVMHESRRGAAAARNTGLWAATGEVVAFTDADCVVDPDWLAHMVRPLQDPGIGLVGGKILPPSGANEVERFGESIHDHQRAIEVFDPPYAISISLATRTDTLREMGGFNEGFRHAGGEDVDLSYRFLQAGQRLAFAPGAVVRHRHERTLGGLFWEGVTHGFNGVHVRKLHADFLRGLGHGRVNLAGYREIGRRVSDWARGHDRTRAACDAVFNAGKKAGKLAGSVRFGHLDL